DTESGASESTIYIRCESAKKLKILVAEINNFIQLNYATARINYKDVDNIFNLIFSDAQAPLVARLRSVENLGANQNNQLKKLWYQVQENLGDLELKPIVWQEHLTVVADQEKLMTYGVAPNALFTALKTAFNEREILSIIDNQNFVPVILGGDSKRIQQVLSETTVQSKDSAIIHVSNFIKVINTQDIKTIVGGVEGAFYPIELNVDTENVAATISTIKKIVHANKWYDVNFTGDFFSNKELMDELKIVLLISLILLYFILASQFESFVLPLIILLEVPLDLAGSFLLLKLFGMSLNLMSMIGIVVMSGIIINDSILKIDTIIQLQRSGHSLIKALLVAGQRRLKPILMTSLTTILALIPLLFSSGLGAELQAPLAISIIGGMLLGTIVSLYFIPLCYYYIAKFIKSSNHIEQEVIELTEQNR
ncbi:MAG: efflux RND transporter permease subunit, partial [Bacteroidetes bacterium]|nr:efflux RND transporter permease subunit [Bacteroidota bacterium]